MTPAQLARARKRGAAALAGKENPQSGSKPPHKGPAMTPQQLKKARHKLSLTLEQMAHVLGYEGKHSESQVHHLETGRRTIRPAQRRLIEAYLSGYRPKDWPRTLS